MPTWYLSPRSGGDGWAAGDDGNDGLSKVSPVLTVQCAVEKCQRGDTIVVGRGRHRVQEGFEEAVLRAKAMNLQFIIL